jgi:hypothetical protein
MFDSKSQQEIEEYIKTKKKDGLLLSTTITGYFNGTPGIRINAVPDIELLYEHPSKDFIGVAATIFNDGKISGCWGYCRYEIVQEDFEFGNSKEFIKAIDRKLIAQKSMIRRQTRFKKRMKE